MYITFNIRTVAIETRDNIDNSYPGDDNHRHRYLSNLGKLHHMNQHYFNIVQNMTSLIFVYKNV